MAMFSGRLIGVWLFIGCRNASRGEGAVLVDVPQDRREELRIGEIPAAFRITLNLPVRRERPGEDPVLGAGALRALHAVDRGEEELPRPVGVALAVGAGEARQLPIVVLPRLDRMGGVGR
jgi:hypothetical protein